MSEKVFPSPKRQAETNPVVVDIAVQIPRIPLYPQFAQSQPSNSYESEAKERSCV
jgi:hypothetical protein